MAARPNTPRGTSDPGKGAGSAPVHIGGNVDFKGANLKNSIATGHIHGYEVILTTINITVDSANMLTKNIQDFVSKVDMQLQHVSSKVATTASILDDMNALVVKQAEKKGLTVNKNVKDKNEPGNEERDRANLGGSPEQSSQTTAAIEILSITCFKAIIERTQGTRKTFDDMSEKIKQALDVIDQLQKLHQVEDETVTGASVRGQGLSSQSAQRHLRTPKKKVVLSEDDRKTVRLTENDLMWMEKTVEIHWNDLFCRFIMFEFWLDHERQDKRDVDNNSMRKNLENVQMIGKAIWKETRRMAKYLCDDKEPPSLRHQFRGPRTWQPPGPVQGHLPEPSQVTSLYVGWEIRKALPLLPPYLHGRLDQQARKPSWGFAVPQRMSFSTEELFLRVLAQAAQRGKSDRTLRDEYWGALKKAGQRAIVDELVQTQNHHLQRDFPDLEWTIAGLETKTDPWALTAAHGRSRAREKKTRNEITAFEVILKTQWRITRGYEPRMIIPGGVASSVGANGLGHLRAPIRSGRGPIIITAGADILVHSESQIRRCHTTRSNHRPMMVLCEQNCVLVKEGGKGRKKSDKKKKKSRRKDSRAQNKRQETSKTRYYVEHRGLRGHNRAAAADPSGGSHRLSSPPVPETSHRPPLIHSLRSPPRPSIGFVLESDGRWRDNVPFVPPIARPPPRQPSDTHVSFAQTQHEQDEEVMEKEAEDVAHGMFDEFSELDETKDRMKNRHSSSEGTTQVPEQELRPSATASVEDEVHRTEETRQRRQNTASHENLSMSVMREVEMKSESRRSTERADLRTASRTLSRMTLSHSATLG